MADRITGIKTANDVELQSVFKIDDKVKRANDYRIQYYKHFDLSDEQLGPTWRYNCWGFTFFPRRYWINTAEEVDKIIEHNCVQVTSGSLRPGDIIRYRDSYNITTHTGRVWEVDSAHNCTKVRSKWGAAAEYVHDPLDVPSSYGTRLAYFRQLAPLGGIGDLWIRDARDDNGEQYSYSQWASPDILVEWPKYDSADVDKSLETPRRVCVWVFNRGDREITNVKVRYYWAIENAGTDPSSWHLITPTTEHPNPTESFTVPAYSGTLADYVYWTPLPQPSHQCLIAVAYVNDDPTDSDNPDPIVYPFNVPWDNNIAALNVMVLSLAKGMKEKLKIDIGLPDDSLKKANADLYIRLTVVPRSPIFGFPLKVIPPKVRVTLGERQPFMLNTKKDVEPFGKVWGPEVPPRDIDFELIHGLREDTFLPNMTEKTVAWRHIKRLPLIAEKPVPLQLEITVPEEAQSDTSFNLHINQEINGVSTGGYTVVVNIV